jgi:hypothetical protein
MSLQVADIFCGPATRDDAAGSSGRRYARGRREAQSQWSPPPATASTEGAQLNGRPFPATVSAEGAQFNVPPSLWERELQGNSSI